MVEKKINDASNIAAKNCMVTVTLLKVLYTGFDLGSTWSFDITANEYKKEIGTKENPVILELGKATILNSDITTIEFENGCNKEQAISISVGFEIKEYYDEDKGMESITFKGKCVHGISNIVNVIKKFGTGKDETTLTFVFQIKCVCR